MKILKPLSILFTCVILAILAGGCALPANDPCDGECEEGDVCIDGNCVPGVSCDFDDDCDDGNPCTLDACDDDGDGGTCSNDPEPCNTTSDCPPGCFASCTGGVCRN